MGPYTRPSENANQGTMDASDISGLVENSIKLGPNCWLDVVGAVVTICNTSPVETDVRGV